MDETPNPGLTLEPNLEAKLEGLDDHLNPIADKPTEDDPKVDEPHEEVKEPEKPAEDKPEDTEKKEEPADEGYTIDEEDEPEAPTPGETAKPSNLTSEQQYILDNLQPITIRGTDGGDRVKEFKVLSPDQLPNNFKYVDDRELSLATKAFSMLETKAETLQNDFRNQESAKSAKAFKEAEDNADRSDIGSLQRDGEIPKFKVEPSDPKFTEDPASVLIQEVLDFKEKKNQDYMEAYNAGRPYRHIGFEEAFLMFKRESPSKANPEQAKEDEERANLAKRTANTTGTKGNETLKPRVHSGMGTMDLDRLIEQKTEGWN